MKIKLPRKKTVLYILTGLSGLFAIGIIGGIQYVKHNFFKETPNTLTVDAGLEPIPFEWDTTTYGDHVESRSAVLIPVSIPGVENNFYMQFDTGSPYTFLRSAAVEQLRQLGVQLETYDSDGTTLLRNMELNVGSRHVSMESGIVRPRSANFDWDDPSAMKIIGTIGADFIDQKVCVIDFPSREISLFDSRMPEMDSLGTFESFSFVGRRIMLPVAIDGTEQWVFYDSGCSAFGLFTSKYHFETYAKPNSREISFDASSHGSPVPVSHKPSDSTIRFGETELPLKRVSYLGSYVGLQSTLGGFVKGGFLGNECLTESKLILDTRNSEYLVVGPAND